MTDDTSDPDTDGTGAETHGASRSRPPVRVRVRMSPTPGSSATPEPRIEIASASRGRRPPNRGSFAPGESGNPAGRPKGAKGVKPMVRKVLSAKTRVRDATGSRKVTIFQALLMKELELAITGDWRARKTVLELGRWALPEEAPESGPVSARETTATDDAIINWFKDEVKSRDREPK